eukprot:scaffold6216_cov149-Amphora_coffeaeformis.AAC.10
MLLHPLSFYHLIIPTQVNKPEAERCRDMGATALRQGNVSRATKLLQKSLQLYPLPGVEALLQQAQQRETSTSGNNNNNDNNNAAGAANAGGGANTTTTTTSTTASAPAPAQRSASMGADGRAYTEEQVKIVQRVLQAKQGGRGAHYRVLNLQSNANEAEIKKAYRKLSLKVHPDKNSAPHADEAFKAVGLAYATLSDPQKRNIYDRYGEEDPDSRGGGGGGGGGPFGGGRRGGGVHMHGQHVDPEDIFNAFFGGAGMPGGGGVHFYSNGFGGPGMHFRPVWIGYAQCRGFHAGGGSIFFTHGTLGDGRVCALVVVVVVIVTVIIITARRNYVLPVVVFIIAHILEARRRRRLSLSLSLSPTPHLAILWQQNYPKSRIFRIMCRIDF